MDYFWIRQDKRYLNTPIIVNVRDIVLKRGDVTIENEKKIANINVAFARPQKNIDFVDILDIQLFLVHERVKEIFEMYEPSMIFKVVCILANITGEYGNYYMPFIPKLDCLIEKNNNALNRSQIKELALNSRHIGSQSIFQVAGLQSEVIVIRLDVLESLLRRQISDFQFDQIEMIDN